jgi:hypothetical protein
MTELQKAPALLAVRVTHRPVRSSSQALRLGRLACVLLHAAGCWLHVSARFCRRSLCRLMRKPPTVPNIFDPVLSVQNGPNCWRRPRPFIKRGEGVTDGPWSLGSSSWSRMHHPDITSYSTNGPSRRWLTWLASPFGGDPCLRGLVLPWARPSTTGYRATTQASSQETCSRVFPSCVASSRQLCSGVLASNTVASPTQG